MSRGGRVDLANEVLDAILAAMLFVVAGADTHDLQLNQVAFEDLDCQKELTVIEGAGHLFEGPGELEQVAQVPADWFADHVA